MCGVGVAPLVGRVPQTPPAAFVAFEETDAPPGTAGDTGPVPAAALAAARAWALGGRSSPRSVLYVGFRAGRLEQQGTSDSESAFSGRFTLAEAPLERDLDAGPKGGHTTVASLPATHRELTESLDTHRAPKAARPRAAAGGKFLVPGRLLVSAAGSSALVLYSELDRDFDLMRPWVDRGEVRHNHTLSTSWAPPLTPLRGVRSGRRVCGGAAGAA